MLKGCFIVHLFGNVPSTVLECSCCRIHRYVATPQHEHEVHKEGLSDPCPWCLASTTWPVTPPSSGPTTSPSLSPPGASTTQAESKFIFLISQHLCFRWRRGGLHGGITWISNENFRSRAFQTQTSEKPKPKIYFYPVCHIKFCLFLRFNCRNE